MLPSNPKQPCGDLYEVEAFEVFDEEYWLNENNDIYEYYQLDLPPTVAQKLKEFERQIKGEAPCIIYYDEEYEAYLSEYYSSLSEVYENQQNPSSLFSANRVLDSDLD